MVKSIKLEQPAVCMIVTGRASRGGVSIAKTVPVTLNSVTKSNRNNNKSGSRQDAVENQSMKTVVDRTLNDQRSLDIASQLALRDQIVDVITRNMDLLQASSSLSVPVSRTGYIAASGGQIRIDSIEALVGAMDRALNQDRQASVLSSLGSVNPVSLFSSIGRDSALYTSSILTGSVSASNSTVFPASGVDRLTTKELVSSRGISASFGLVDSVGLINPGSSLTTTMPSVHNHKHSPLQDRIRDTGKSSSCKGDKAVNRLDAGKGGLWFNLRGLIEDSFGSGPLWYQQDMENGPPLYAYSSNPRELGES